MKNVIDRPARHNERQFDLRLHTDGEFFLMVRVGQGKYWPLVHVDESGFCMGFGGIPSRLGLDTVDGHAFYAATDATPLTPATRRRSNRREITAAKIVIACFALAALLAVVALIWGPF